MHPILSTIIQRLGLGLLTLFIVSIIIFSSLEFLPGDFGQAVLGQAAVPETVEAFRRELGLDRPPVERYFMWIGNVLQGDLGNAFSGRNASGVDRSREVWAMIEPRLMNTLFLATMAAVIAVPSSRPRPGRRCRLLCGIWKNAASCSSAAESRYTRAW